MHHPLGSLRHQLWTPVAHFRLLTQYSKEVNGPLSHFQGIFPKEKWSTFQNLAIYGQDDDYAKLRAQNRQLCLVKGLPGIDTSQLFYEEYSNDRQVLPSHND